ncbi:MAG: pyridoxal 5'-phosphate synthase glutaminase subunit PdxT [Dehalococcoidia bacterium]|nr:pyridoxal 5'-phosphate synthase glutaminase subunit PdxT [Dehalococcoidia bacterium]
MRIGVLALQGAFIEHAAVIRRLGEEASEIRLPGELDKIDGLIIPGGESTTITNLIRSFNLLQPLKERIRGGMPVLGTCAGMICLAKRVSNSDTSHMETLALMDVEVKRNAFGRQVDSFEIDLPVPVLGEEPFHAVFIRAPLIKSTGPGVDILAKLPDGTIVASRQKNMLVTSFHPELTEDPRLHKYFLSIVASSGK